MNSTSNIKDKEELENGSSFTPSYNADGLVTAVAQHASNGEILMLAHMNADAVAKTVETGKAHFWSRSRGKLWMKGETSGNTLDVVEILTDCDQDAIVMKVALNGKGACHTGAYSCFYRKVTTESGAPKLVRIER